MLAVFYCFLNKNEKKHTKVQSILFLCPVKKFPKYSLMRLSSSKVLKTEKALFSYKKDQKILEYRGALSPHRFILAVELSSSNRDIRDHKRFHRECLRRSKDIKETEMFILKFFFGCLCNLIWVPDRFYEHILLSTTW